jgi:probable HAF family extracellular repeat protein
MRTFKLTLGYLLILWPAAWCGASKAAESFFLGLGDLPGGSFISSASGVSADGSVVVGIGSSASGTEGFRWTIDSGMVGLGGGTRPSDVSANGSVVVGQWGSQAFRWKQNTGLIGLGDFPGGLFYSIANAASADGSVIVGRGAREVCDRNGCRNIFPAFRWTHTSGLTIIGIGTAADISSDGTVVVGGRSQAARWTQEGGGVSLGDLPSGTLNSFAWGVSADGSVIVGQGTSDAGREAFRWTESSGMVGLGIPAGFDFSRAQDVSADGSVVVGSLGIGVNTDGSPFIWDAAHGIRNLQDVLANEFGLAPSLAGWTLNYASAVSADGQFIVGGGINPIGNPEAWIARLAPVAPLPGDFNDDGAVDAADYVVWRKSSGTQAGYETWRAHFGATAGSGAALPSASPLSAAVPELNSMLLSAITMACISAHTRTSCRHKTSR